MPVSSNSEIPTGINLFGGVGARGFWSSIAPPQSHVAVAVTAVAGVAFFAALLYTTNRGRLRSPWSRGIRKHALSPQQWRNLFTSEGKLLDGGVTLLKIVRSGGIHPSIRAEVWPFLLGVYDLNSTKEEREIVQSQKRKEYEKLRRKCKQLNESLDRQGDCRDLDLNKSLPSSKDVVSDQDSLLVERSPYSEYSDDPSSAILEGDDSSTRVTSADASDLNSKFSDSDSEDPEVIQASPPSNIGEGDNNEMPSKQNSSFSGTEVHSKVHTVENFSTWQRIIRLDAVRANGEWMSYDESRATVSDDQARNFADAVGLKDYDHLEPCRIYHAARLVAILEAYALYDPEIGYCQGMSDLLSPIITVISEDHQAFWCFIGFMKKARHNFRLDEVGIRRQLNIVSKIIKCKDITLYRHLEDLQAEDCFFVYRMVVVLFRRELTFEQTLCLWEVMWADQAAIRAGIGKSAWSRIRQRAPPTDDLLLYAIAASVLQKNKLIIQRHSSMDEILKECNDMAGQLDVWKLLDDAHDLVVTLHDKIETSL